MSDKDTVQEIFDLGVRAFVREDIDLSVEKFSEVIRLAPEFGLAYVSRGSAYLCQERVREALADFSRAIETDPGHARAYHLRDWPMTGWGMRRVPAGILTKPLPSTRNTGPPTTVAQWFSRSWGMRMRRLRTSGCTPL